MAKYVTPFANDAGYDPSDPYGHLRENGVPHLGSDWERPAGTPIRSVTYSTVVLNMWSSVLGWVLGVQTADGVFMGYCHLLEQSPFGVGSVLDVGQEGIAKVGNTGSASKGNHLHMNAGTTSGAFFGVGFGSTLFDPHAHIVKNLGGLASSGESLPITEQDDIMQLTEIIFDQGPNTAPGYASTAIITPVTGFVQTSAGYEGRGALEGYKAIADVLGFPRTEKHVDANGWALAQLFAEPALDAKTRAALVAAMRDALDDVDFKDNGDVNPEAIAKIASAAAKATIAEIAS